MTAPFVCTDRSVGDDPYRVMVVDDSAVIRGFICRYLEEDARIKVVATAANGQMALRSLMSVQPEVVVLDIEMPVMDGMTALPQILAAAPGVRVVMASTLTRKNADVSLKALQMGAADYVPKPETSRELSASIDFRRELVEKVKAYAHASRRARGAASPAANPLPGASPASRHRTFSVVSRRSANAEPRHAVGTKAPIVLRPPSQRPPAVLAIGASTGGPQALLRLLGDIKDAVRHLPVLIVQHMPATFTPILAAHLERASGLPAAEASDGVGIEPGRVYVAPGNYHMTVAAGRGGHVLHLNQEPPENFCRPAVNPLFHSIAEVFGARGLAVVLTGMGHDGLRGARELVSRGGTLLAQDEASSIVWGMPGAVATAGLCSAVVPLADMGRTIGGFTGAGQ